jgi:hypothetical protein
MSQVVYSILLCDMNYGPCTPQTFKLASVFCTALKIRKPTYKAWTFKNKLYFINSVLNSVFTVKVTTQDNYRSTYKVDHLSNIGKKREIEIGNIPWTITP